MVGQPFHSSPDQVPAIPKPPVLLICPRNKRNPLSPVTGDRAVTKCLWQGLCPAGESQTPRAAWLEEKPQGSWWQGELGQAGGHSPWLFMLFIVAAGLDTLPVHEYHCSH